MFVMISAVHSITHCTPFQSQQSVYNRMDPCLSLVTNSKMGVIYAPVLPDVQQAWENVLNVFTIISVIWFYAQLPNHCREEETKEFHSAFPLQRVLAILQGKKHAYTD